MPRVRHVTDFKALAEKEGSSLGKFLAYILFSSLNFSIIDEEHQVSTSKTFELDEFKNKIAREKEMVEGVFVVRASFKTSLNQMLNAAEQLIEDDLTEDEIVFTRMFIDFINDYKKGTLYSDDVLISFLSALDTNLRIKKCEN